MSAEEVAKAFVAHFYTTFDSNVEGLTTLYVSDIIIFSRAEVEVVSLDDYDVLVNTRKSICE